MLSPARAAADMVGFGPRKLSPAKSNHDAAGLIRLKWPDSAAVDLVFV